MKKNYPVTQKENDYNDRITIISTTDTKGIITYVNQDFVEVSGFSEEELLGKNHNIVRHPDMPPVAFQDLWDTVKTGRSWRGIVKNRCKNGDHYWVDAYVTPVYEQERLVGYQSVRVKPKRKEIEQAEALYAKLWEGKVKKAARRKLFDLGVGTKTFVAFAVMFFLTVAAGAAGLLGMQAQEQAAAAYRQQVTGGLDRLQQLEGADRTGAPSASAKSLASLRRQLQSVSSTNTEPLGGLILAIVVLSLGFAVFAVLAIRRNLVRPLAAATDIAKAIAAGDLSQRIDVGMNDEVGQLLQAVKMMQARLQMVIGRLAEFSEQLSADARALTSVADRNNEGVRRQRSEIDMVATAMTEMATAVQEVANHATEAAGAAHKAKNEAGEGTRVVGAVVESINGLAGEVERSADVIRRLDQRSESIGTVIDVIRGIAEQTNLLALNAAIEAARAGEQGRGFAVVADEVRTLAQRTQGSTQEIQEIVEALQSEASEAVQVMEQGRGQAQGSVEQASEAGRVLRAITDAVAAIDELNAQIATAAEEQGAVSGEIDRNIANITEVADETAQGAEETSRYCEHMAGQTGELEGLVKQFRR
jgi:aerotaxis receptor